MEKSNLKTGMIVETRNSERYIVILNFRAYHEIISCIYNENSSINLDSYNKNLICDIGSDFDITKIYSLMVSKYNITQLELIWERQEEKPKPKLTERDRAYLKAYSYDYEWIARDDDDCLTFFKEKPVKKTNGWHIGYIFNTDNLCIKDLFSFIKWEDEEPYRIKELLI